MTLTRSDGDGYKVISDLGKIYGLYEMKTIGTNVPKTRDTIAIIYENGEEPEDEEIIGFFYGATEENIKCSTSYIRNVIMRFENEKFKNEPNLYSDVVTTF